MKIVAGRFENFQKVVPFSSLSAAHSWSFSDFSKSDVLEKIWKSSPEESKIVAGRIRKAARENPKKCPEEFQKPPRRIQKPGRMNVQNEAFSPPRGSVCGRPCAIGCGTLPCRRALVGGRCVRASIFQGTKPGHLARNMALPGGVVEIGWGETAII